MLANFEETQSGRYIPASPATIEVDALPGQKLEGKVESLSGGAGSSSRCCPADNATGNFVKVVQRVPVRIARVHPGDARAAAGRRRPAAATVGESWVSRPLPPGAGFLFGGRS